MDPASDACDKMLKKLLSRYSPNVEPTVERSGPPTVPDGSVVWSIGDVHGRLDLLTPLLDHIVHDARGSSGTTTVVMLGDYIDRGPDSRGVIEFLEDLAVRQPVELHLLRGNHEEKMETFLRDPSIGPKWCEYGGREALRSFGVSAPSLSHRPEAWKAVANDLSHVMTDAHRSFFKRLKDHCTIGDYFFTHAGARPGVPLSEQTSHDMRWIRHSFLRDERPFEKIIVHGHTPATRHHNDQRRIGIDTEAYRSGRLTAVRLEGQSQRFFESSGAAVTEILEDLQGAAEALRRDREIRVP